MRYKPIAHSWYNGAAWLMAALGRRWQLLPVFHSWPDRLLFLQVLVLAAFAPLLMRVLFPKYLHLLISERLGKRSRPVEPSVIIDYVRRAIAIGHPLIESRCVTRCLTQAFFLNRQGLNIAIVFGANTTKSGFSAHCWLLRDGHPYLADAEIRDRYAVTYAVYRHGAANLPART